MEDDNKRNLQYFEALTMRELYDQMEGWQLEHKKRLLSVSIERDQDHFCCIALTNPSEVVIVSGNWGRDDQAAVSNRSLRIAVGTQVS